MATPNPLGPAIPPELTRYAEDWPTAQGNLPAHRSAVNSSISAATGEMVALNVTDGTVRWKTEVETFCAGGATVANDVVFGAGLDGIVRGFATATGDEIWSYQAGAGINAPLAIAGDTLLVPAGGPFISKLASLPPLQNELIAFRVEDAAPTGTPEAKATPIR